MLKMKKIALRINELLEKLQEISDEKMDFVVLSFVDDEVDQKRIFPAFIHFLGVSENGFYKDYESLDAMATEQMKFICALSA